MELECLSVEMSYRGDEFPHRRCRRLGMALCGLEIEPAISGQGDIGVLVAVPHMGGPALCDSEWQGCPGSETHGCPMHSAGCDLARGVIDVDEIQHDIAGVDLVGGQ